MTTVQQNSVTGRLTFRAKGRAKREEAVVDAAVGRVPRIARLMALAIKLNGMLERGEVTSQRELADLARITPARLTQILNLNQLAPDLQERLLFLPPVTQGRDPLGERGLRPLTPVLRWSGQRQLFHTL
ncbi:MAG: hypothetical protein U0640_02155 [Phycisphaerales bacterium]